MEQKGSLTNTMSLEFTQMPQCGNIPPISTGEDSRRSGKQAWMRSQPCPGPRGSSENKAWPSPYPVATGPGAWAPSQICLSEVLPPAGSLRALWHFWNVLPPSLAVLPL